MVEVLLLLLSSSCRFPFLVSCAGCAGKLVRFNLTLDIRLSALQEE